KKHGKGDFGKVAQKLLAIVFCRLGYEHIEERGVQGVDIDAASGEEKYAVEVKTTAGDEGMIGQKDVDGLQRRIQDGYEPIFAVLKIGILSDWIVASAKNVQVGVARLGRLSVDCVQALQDEVNRYFGPIVMEYGPRLLAAPRGRAQFVAERFL